MHNKYLCKLEQKRNGLLYFLSQFESQIAEYLLGIEYAGPFYSYKILLPSPTPNQPPPMVAMAVGRLRKDFLKPLEPNLTNGRPWWLGGRALAS